MPPTPHPPLDHIAVLATSEGLLLRHHTLGIASESHVKIAWGRQVVVTEQAGDGDSAGNWSESVVVYGIVGILELLEGARSNLRREYKACISDLVHSVVPAGHLCEGRHRAS